MNRFINLLPLAASLLLYSLLWVALQPVLGYNLDSDCVAYLTIAKRMAQGDFLGSVNGLWSPMNSAILALFIRDGKDAWEMAKLLNFIFGAIILVQSFFLFRNFNLNRKVLWYILPALGVAMVQFVYFQMFGDILQLIFVLGYLFILWRKKSDGINYWQAIFSGIMMGIAFYAKAYSFFFFGVHFLATLSWYVYQRRMQWQKALLVYVSGILFALIVMLPWTFALHKKYNEWSINGFAGKLNMSWYINSAKSYKPSIRLLIPPAYNDSPSFWEDPYLSQGHLDGPFTSGHHFLKWIVRVIHTIIVTVFCFNEISFLGLALFLISLFYFFFLYRNKEVSQAIFDVQLLIVTIGVLPLGYLMMHIETRYIWLNVILLMLLGAITIEKISDGFSKKISMHIFYLILAASFMLFPVFQMENLKLKNKDLFDTSAALKEDSIKGSFTSNTTDAGRMWVIAYLTGSNYYTIEKSNYTSSELFSELKRYQVKYYFFEKGNGAPDVGLTNMKKIGTYGGIEVFECLY